MNFLIAIISTHYHRFMGCGKLVENLLVTCGKPVSNSVNLLGPFFSKKFSTGKTTYSHFIHRVINRGWYLELNI